QVQQAGVAVRAELDDLALEELGGEAQEADRAADRVAEGAHPAALGEVVPDGVAVHSVAGLEEVPLVARGRWPRCDGRHRLGGTRRRCRYTQCGAAYVAVTIVVLPD